MPSKKLITTAHSPLAKVTTLLLVAAGAASLYVANSSLIDPYKNIGPQGQGANLSMEHTAFTLLFVEVILAYLLKYLQGGIYWFFWLQLKVTKPDERQKIVRQKVMEQAYGYGLVVVFVMGSVLGGSLSNYATGPRQAVSSSLLWVTIVFLVSLPSMLAAWRKDS